MSLWKPSQADFKSPNWRVLWAEYPQSRNPLSITLHLKEWKNLCSQLRVYRKKQPNGPQLGRLAWMTVAAIEAAIAETEEREK